MQVVAPQGILLGAGVYHFVGSGDPNSLSLVTFPLLASCAVGSIYSRTDVVNATAQLYVCTTAGTPASATWDTPAVAGVWTSK
jgi:hypothetical protein